MADKTPDVTAQLGKYLEKKAKSDLLSYFFLSQTKPLTQQEVCTLAAQLGLKDVLEFTPIKEKLSGSYYHLSVFKTGNDLKHDGRVLKGPHEDVTIKVQELHPALSPLKVTSLADDAAKKLLDALEVLDEESSAVIMNQVKLLITEGKVVLDEKAAEIHATMEILKKLGVDVGLKKLIPKISTHFLKELQVMSDEEQLKKIQSFMMAAISIGFSVKNIAETVKIIVQDKDYFNNQVKKWFNGVRLQLEKIVNQLGHFIKSIETHADTKDPKELVSAMTSLKILSMQVNSLCQKLPALQQKIVEYAKSTQVLIDQQAARRNAALMASLASLAFSLPDLIKNGWEAMDSLQKADFVIGMVQTGVSATEAATSAYSVYQMTNHMNQAKEYAKFYEETQEQLESLKETIEQGQSTGPSGLPFLLDDFKSSQKSLTELLKRAKEISKD